MKIDKQLLTVNKYSRPGTKRSKTTKVAWHYVGNAGSSAQANRNYFNNLANTKKTYASSHYIIGLNGEIIYCVPEGEIAYTTNDANSYSIGIEMCHPDNSGKFNTNTYNSAVELGVDLCKRYKLNPLKDFIRHYDVTKKICPKYWVDKPSEWEKFKKDVYNKLNESTGSSSSSFKNGDYTGKKAKVITNVLNVRHDRGTQYNVIDKLNKGEIVKLNYCLNGWISIEGYKGNKGLGYVSTEYLEIIL
ncbi:MAG: N-acetylmuramoyl-L-alanine amidase [Romboutsia sp.]|uniref:N-acetylmuramoyl-L-alanine amidase n=1 Tax=Romboutsia sp. TaxID=1965302 RepID=UPI003F3EC3B6